MAKCPWCPAEIEVKLHSKRGFFHRCPNECYTSFANFSTSSEALAAASKRFMPKRTVEEISEKLCILCHQSVIEISSLFDKAENTEEYNSLQKVANARLSRRIADFIYGAE